MKQVIQQQSQNWRLAKVGQNVQPLRLKSSVLGNLWVFISSQKSEVVRQEVGVSKLKFSRVSLVKAHVKGSKER